MGASVSVHAERDLTSPSEESVGANEQSRLKSGNGDGEGSQRWLRWLMPFRSDDGSFLNPGGFDEVNQEAAAILRPNFIDGLSFNFNAPVSESFMLGSAVELNAKDRSSAFAMTANYFTNRVVMLSRMTPNNGRLNGRVFISHTPLLTTKVVADVSSEPDSSRISCDVDYRTSRSSSQMKFATGRIIAFNHLQSLLPHFAVGMEALVQTQSGFGAITFALKHHNPSRVVSLSAASFGPLVASYVRKVSQKVSLATELLWDTRTNESHLTLGYKFDLSSATVIGHVDSLGRVAATLEERVNPALSLTLSSELDHVKEKHSFGFGINIGSN